MNNDTRSAAFYIADNKALDLLNSIAAPSGTEIEWLGDGRDLLDWLEQANLVTTTELEQFRSDKGMLACDAIAAKTRDLREWFRQFVIKHAGQALTSSDLNELTVINEILINSNVYTQITSHLPENFHSSSSTAPKPALYCTPQRHWRDENDLLLVLAEVIADIICNTDFRLVKNCEGPSCSLWFYDISKNHSRRWCTMSVCGNRAKAAQHRAKKKASIQTPSK